MIPLLLLLACTPSPPQPAQPDQPASPPAQGSVLVDQHQQHPPIPADNPAWDWDAGGFVPDAGWYGEHSWADVRMRVAGHLSVATRDLARLRAGRGDYAGCAAAHQELLATLQGLGGGQGVAAEIESMLVQASQREAALCTALAAGAPPPVQGDGLFALRSQLLGLLQRHATGEELGAEATAVQQRLLPFLEPRPELDLDEFRDFDDRHRLRVALFQAYLDSADPLGVDEPWGYWEPTELQRTALVLGLVAGRLGGEDWSTRAAERLAGDPGLGLDQPPLRWPSELAAALPRKEAIADFTVEGMGWLPTGDSLIDVAAEPGPRAIGTLEKLGTDDLEHQAWLAQHEHRLDQALAGEPQRVPAMVEGLVAEVDAMGHGSRYYTIKQLRNEAIRQLARAGQLQLARDVLARSWPLHNQDWACPNRQGILEALDGRLLLVDGDPTAENRLEEAVSTGQHFLELIDAAERGEAVGARPPMMGQGPAGPPGGPPPGARGPQGPPLPPGQAPRPQPRPR